jgi:hypothetical protein
MMKSASSSSSDVAQMLINLRIAESEIFAARAFGHATPLAEIVGKRGFKTENEFWDAELSEPMTSSAFVQLLRDCLLPPAYKMTSTHPRTWQEEMNRIEKFLHSSLKVAFNSGEPWFIKTPDRQPLIKPRPAAEWLLSKPMRADSVPIGLKAFIEQEVNAAAETNRPAKVKRGAPISERVIEAMKAFDPTNLGRMTEKEMEGTFGACRTTCRDARKSVNVGRQQTANDS